MTDEKNAEIWVRMYEEQMRHGRHHEELRTQSTNIIVAISAALIALLDDGSTYIDSTVAGAFIIIINLYGLLMSLKHYERSRLHVGVGGAYRSIISKFATIGEYQIDSKRSEAKENHGSKFIMSKVRAYYLWSGLHILLIFIGLMIVVLVT